MLLLIVLSCNVWYGEIYIFFEKIKIFFFEKREIFIFILLVPYQIVNLWPEEIFTCRFGFF